MLGNGVMIAVVGLGGWYPRGIARLINEFELHSPGFKILSWSNTLPPGAPDHVIEDGYDYTAYCAKPFALLETYTAGADVGILVDAAFYPIRPIHPLVEHIAQNGYYLCKNGFSVGAWCSDRALKTLGLTRDKAMAIQEASSYCVGLNWHDPRCLMLIEEWTRLAVDRITFPGPHTNVHRLDNNPGFPSRNAGFVSHDHRVNGHRHDQTALSVIAHKLGMTDLVSRPKFTTYAGHQTSETVLVNKGGL